MSARRLLVVLAAVAPLLAAGCGGSHHATTRPSSRSLPGPARRFPPRFSQAGCSTMVAAAHPLTVRTAFRSMQGPPFGVAVTRDGRWSFVDQTGGTLAVLSDAGFTPRLVRTIALPQDAVGNSLTPDGRYLLIANGGDGATVVDVQRAESGSGGAVLGTLTDRSGRRPGGGGAIEVTRSNDGRYVFVSLEDAGTLAVYDLRTALRSAFRDSGYVGAIPVGIAPVGMAVSPDGRWLYATSEVGATSSQGTLSVISVREAERDPSHAVLRTATAHCSPVRVVVSPDGGVVWVTARESDQLLAFSAAGLRSDPGHALLATVRVGEAPVGLALVDGARDLIVGDSNRFGVRGASAELTVVSTVAALDHHPAIVGSIASGAFPREMALEPSGGTLLVGNFGSEQLEAVSVKALP